jgi:group I intron endonuclease
MGFIYRIRCKENGKSYIGRSLHDPLLRWKQHVYKSRRPESRTLLGNAINKYGESAFEIETLCELPEESLDNMECYYAEQYESYVWEGGYNQTLCGRGRPYDYNTKEETKRKMSQARLGKSLGAETKAKLSASMQGHKRCVGRVMSVESKAKNRAAQPSLKLTDDNVRYIRENPEKLSKYALAKKLGVSRSLVYLVVCGKSHKDVV